MFSFVRRHSFISLLAALSIAAASVSGCSSRTSAEEAAPAATAVVEVVTSPVERPAVPPHPLGGPQPAFCDLEEHNALTAHQERRRIAATAATNDDKETP